MTAISEAVSKLVLGRDLEYEEARSVMDSIMSGQCSSVSIASYLTALAQKGETMEEIAASAAEMRAHSIKLPATWRSWGQEGTGPDPSTYRRHPRSSSPHAASGSRSTGTAR